MSTIRARRCLATMLLLAACEGFPEPTGPDSIEAEPGHDAPSDPSRDDDKTARAGEFPTWKALPECGSTERPWVTFRGIEGRCPAPKSCLRIDQPGDGPLALHLTKDCSYDRVEFQVVRPNVTLDCHDATLSGTGPVEYDSAGHPFVEYGNIALSVIDIQRVYWEYDIPSGQEVPADNCSRSKGDELLDRGHAPDQLVENVTIQNCKVKGYETGALVRLFRQGSALTFFNRLSERYLTWFHHPNERQYRMNQIDDCMRAAAPREVTFDNVKLLGPLGNGLHAFGWVHEVTFTNGEIRDSKGGTGVYLSPGSRHNVISGNDITNNFREGVAIDASAYNRIIDNTIERNGLNWWQTFAPIDVTGRTDFYYVGVTVFKNAWEGRYASSPSGPRNQHASDNEISGNTFRDHDTGVWIGYRQGKDYQGQERGDPVYYVGQDGDFNYKKYAERTIVANNKFYDTRVGVRVQDDDAIINGNWFLAPKPAGWYQEVVAVDVGHNVRRAAGEPVKGTTVTNNLFAVSHDFGVLEHDCSLLSTVAGNNEGEPNGVWTPVPNRRRGCAVPQARMGMYLSGASGPSGALTGLRTTPTFKDEHTWLAGDFNADGRADLVSIFKADDQRPRVWLHLSSGTTFGYEDSFQTLEIAHQPGPGQWLAGNFDGVGGDDLVYVMADSSTATHNYFWRSEGTGFSPGYYTARFQKRTLTMNRYSGTHRWLVGDVNADGKDDIVEIFGKDNSIRVVTHRSISGESFELLSSDQIYGTYLHADQWLMADVNGDGRDDLVQVFADAAGMANVRARRARSAASGGFEWESWVQPFAGAGGGLAGFFAGRRWLSSDFDGDGKDDVILLYGASGKARAWRNRSTGSGLAHVGIQTLGSFDPAQRWLSGRFNNDSRDDLALVYPSVWQ